MKAKIIIEDGFSKIELEPETTFEKRLIEDGYSSHANAIATFKHSKNNGYSWEEEHLLTIVLHPPVPVSPTTLQ